MQDVHMQTHRVFSVKLCLDLQERCSADCDVSQPDLGFVVQERAWERVCIQGM